MQAKVGGLLMQGKGTRQGGGFKGRAEGSRKASVRGDSEKVPSSQSRCGRKGKARNGKGLGKAKTRHANSVVWCEGK